MLQAPPDPSLYLLYHGHNPQSALQRADENEVLPEGNDSLPFLNNLWMEDPYMITAQLRLYNHDVWMDPY